MKPTGTFWVKEVMRLTGVSASTLQHYHDIGLLPRPTRSASCYKLYDAEHVFRVRHILSQLARGKSLDEIRGSLGDPSSNHEEMLLAS